MDKKNYRESLEKDRQEVITDSNLNLSRRAQRQSGKQKAKKGRNLLLPTLFFVFILIPVTILIYVALIFKPDDTLIASENENEVSVESVSPTEDSTVIIPEETDEDVADAAVETDPGQKEESEVVTEEKPEETPQEEASEDVVVPAENEQAEEQEAVEDVEPEQVNTDTPNVETPEDPAASGGKTVVVKDNETLYRIAVNNYGSSGAAAAVEKIKQANGLGSNEIYVGQTLILP